MKWTLDKGYQQLTSFNPFVCNYVYFDVLFRALADETDQWHYTDTALVHSKIPVRFSDQRMEAPEEYEQGRKIELVMCTVPRRHRKAFVKVMEERDAELRQICGQAYIENIERVTTQLKENRKHG